MFCKNCGTQISENTKFCKNCGAVHQPGNGFNPTVNAAPVQQQTPNNIKKLHCLTCKSNNIQVTTESSVMGAVTANHGTFSTTHVSNNHQTFWVCSDCGTKFRNTQSLEEEIRKNKNSPIWLFIFAAISLVLFIFFFLKIQESVAGQIFFGSFTFASGLSALLFTIYGFASIKKLKKMRAELEYLKINCYN